MERVFQSSTTILTTRRQVGPRIRIVQYASLVSDLVTKTKQLLSRLITSGGNDFVNLRMRTAFHTELIVTSANDYILVAIMKTRALPEEEEAAGEEVKA